MKHFVLVILIILMIVVLPSSAFAALVDINKATIEELEELTGVGAVIANRIIEYRNSIGPFKTIEEIKNVKGIGEVNFLKMKDQITVGEAPAITNPNNVEVTDNNEDDDEENNSNNTPAEVTSSGNGSQTVSTHSSQTSLSNTSEKLDWEISAGRSRRALVDTPIIFEAKTVKGEPVGFISYTWSFGDGGTYSGKDVSHSYRFPGVYQVVVNGKSNNASAVARTTVLVELPKIKISWLGNGEYAAKIKNEHPSEINLGGFRISSGPTTLLTIPHDTIVSGGGEVFIALPGAHAFSGLIGSDLALYSPAGREISEKNNIEPVLAQNNLAAVTVVAPTVKIKPAAPALEVATTGEDIIELTPAENTNWWQRFISWLRY